MTMLRSKRLTRRITLALLMGGVAGPVVGKAPQKSDRPVVRGGSAQSPQRSFEDSGALVAQAKLSGVTGFAVANANTGQLLEARGGQTALPPASVCKAITALYALRILGAQHRFSTRLLTTGPISAGVLNGDLILAGGGDPTLDTDDLAALARGLKAAGITRISGAFQVYGGVLPEQFQIDGSQPDHVGYNPALSGLNLNFNRVHFQWKRVSGKWQITMDARSKGNVPQVTSSKMRIVSREAPLFTYEGADSWTVASAALGKGGSRWMPVRRPALYAGNVFKTLARGQGITLPEPTLIKSLPKSQTILRQQSDPLSDIVRSMLKFSTNLTAEILGMAATQARTGRVRSVEASAREMNRWALSALQIPMAMKDHSGLSDASRISPAALVAFMNRSEARTMLPVLLKSHAMRGTDNKVQKNHPLKVQAKTGSLNFVSTLAGYITTPNGQLLSFAIQSGDLPRRAGLNKAQRERPTGGSTWARGSRRLQQVLIQNWGRQFGS